MGTTGFLRNFDRQDFFTGPLSGWTLRVAKRRERAELKRERGAGASRRL